VILSQKKNIQTISYQHVSFISPWHRPGFRIWTRIIIMFVSLTFVFPYITWAFTPETFQNDSSTICFSDRVIKIPKKFGSIVQSFQGKGRVVIHIQDLHCHYEIQSNIAKIIDYMAGHYGLQLVTIEGASQPVNVTKLSSFPVEKVKKEVGDYFMRQGKISGAEFYAATGRHVINLEGIENPDHYREGRECVMSFLNNESQGYIWDIRETLNELKTKIYTPELRAFDAKKMAFCQGELSLFQYCRFLYKTACKSALDLSAFPQLVQYATGQSKMFSRKIDSEQLYREVDKADAYLRELLYTHADQRSLDQLYHRLNIMEKMLSIAVSNEEFAEYRAQPYLFKINTFKAFIERHDESGNLTLPPEVYQLENYLKKVETFYANADLRSQDFVRNLLAQMKQHQTQLSILITGGYHTQHILNLLRRQNISFISIKPNLSRVDVLNPYFSLLQRQRTPLEKLLAQNQNIFALEPFFAQFDNANAIIDESQLPEDIRIGYRMLEMTLKLDYIRFVQQQGVAALETLKDKYEQVMADYRADGRNIMPNFEKALSAGRTLLIPMNHSFFAVIHPAGQRSMFPGTAIQTLPLNIFEISFYDNAEWSAIAERVQGKGQRTAGQDVIRARLLQALMAAGALVNGAAILSVQVAPVWLAPFSISTNLRNLFKESEQVILRDLRNIWSRISNALAELSLSLKQSWRVVSIGLGLIILVASTGLSAETLSLALSRVGQPVSLQTKIEKNIYYTQPPDTTLQQVKKIVINRIRELGTGQVFVKLAEPGVEDIRPNVEEADQHIRQGMVTWREEGTHVIVRPKDMSAEDYTNMLANQRVEMAEALLQHLEKNDQYWIGLEGSDKKSQRLNRDEAFVGIAEGKLRCDVSEAGITLQVVGISTQDYMREVRQKRKTAADNFWNLFTDQEIELILDMSDREAAEIADFEQLGFPNTEEASAAIRRGELRYSVPQAGTVILKFAGLSPQDYYQRLREDRQRKVEEFEKRLSADQVYVDLESETEDEEYTGTHRPNVVEALAGIMSGKLDWKTGTAPGSVLVYVIEMETAEYFAQVQKEREAAAKEFESKVKAGQVFVKNAGVDETDFSGRAWPNVIEAARHIREGRLVYSIHEGIRQLGIVGKPTVYFRVLEQERKALERQLTAALAEPGVVFIEISNASEHDRQAGIWPNIFEVIRGIRSGKLIPEITDDQVRVQVVGGDSTKFIQEIRRAREKSANEFLKFFLESPREEIQRGSIQGTFAEDAEKVKAAIAPYGFANHRIESYQAIKEGRMVWSYEDHVLIRHVVGKTIIAFVEDLIVARQDAADDMIRFMLEKGLESVEVMEASAPQLASTTQTEKQKKKSIKGKKKKLTKAERKHRRLKRQKEMLSLYEAYRSIMSGLVVPRRVQNELKLEPVDLSRQELLRSVNAERKNPTVQRIADFLARDEVVKIGGIVLTRAEIIQGIALKVLQLQTDTGHVTLRVVPGIAEEDYLRELKLERESRQQILTAGSTAAPTSGVQVKKPLLHLGIAVVLAGALLDWLFLSAGINISHSWGTGLSMLLLPYFVYRLPDVAGYFKKANSSYDLNDFRKDLKKLQGICCYQKVTNQIAQDFSLASFAAVRSQCVL